MIVKQLFQVQTHQVEDVAFARRADEIDEHDEYHHHLMIMIIFIMITNDEDNDIRHDCK